MKISKILKAAKEKISTPERWTKGWFAKDVLGTSVEWGCDSAISWCAAGAIRYAAEPKSKMSDPVDPSFDARMVFLRVNRLHDISAFNDDSATEHNDVMKAFDAAIAAAEREGL